MKKIEKFKNMGVQVTESMFNAVYEIGLLEDRSMSAVMRVALRDFIARYDAGLPVIFATEKGSNETEK